MKRLRHFLVYSVAVSILLAIAGGIAAVSILWRLKQDMPDYQHLADYVPPISSRIHAGDGSLIGEYAREHRLFVPIDAIPKRVIHAFLASEDQRFFDHSGVDYISILRAAVDNVFHIIRGRRLEGASTITQQVAKNFLLTNEVTLERKLREIMLAFRLEQAFTKNEILELYLNEIYLGMGAYGVAAAALNYFNKPLDNLTIEEAAYLAALPKAPNNYHPVRRPDAALGRRNWVIGRMVEEGYISEGEGQLAWNAALSVVPRTSGVQLMEAQYFVEEVRRELLRHYGEDELYEGGLSVRTTLDPSMQIIARRALRDGLTDYDRRQGWRGPVARLPLQELATSDDWAMRLARINLTPPIEEWRMAMVLEVSEKQALIGFQTHGEPSGDFANTGERGVIPFSDVQWASRVLIEEQDGSGSEVATTGPAPQSMEDVLAVGDVVFVEPQWPEISSESETDSAQPASNSLALSPHESVVEGNGIPDRQPDYYSLRQEPRVNGAILAMDPFTGRILAMEGGFSYPRSEFNRATQAWRQPGSSFKPFVYAAALDHGYTPASIVLDAPFVIDQGAELGFWKPHNYGNRFYGPSTLRTGIEKSRNVMTVRLVQTMGITPVIDYARRFGITDRPLPLLSTALGATETTLMRLTAAYGILANGGRKVTPVLVDRIQDRWGRSIYRGEYRECIECNPPIWKRQPEPAVVDSHDRVISPQTAYQLVSMLEGVVQRGTAHRVRGIGAPVAGKTGTTNEERDAWFVGFSPNLVVGVFVGFDEPETLGEGETGSRVAAPVFRDFMATLLADKPAVPFRVPPGVNLIRVNAQTGQPAGPEDEQVILEAFKEGAGPLVSNREQFYDESLHGVSSGTGGGYRAERLPPAPDALYGQNDNPENQQWFVQTSKPRLKKNLPALTPPDAGESFTDGLY